MKNKIIIEAESQDDFNSKYNFINDLLEECSIHVQNNRLKIKSSFGGGYEIEGIEFPIEKVIFNDDSGARIINCLFNPTEDRMSLFLGYHGIKFIIRSKKY